MKKILLISLLFTTQTVLSKTTEEQVVGKWVCSTNYIAPSGSNENNYSYSMIVEYLDSHKYNSQGIFKFANMKDLAAIKNSIKSKEITDNQLLNLYNFTYGFKDTGTWSVSNSDTLVETSQNPEFMKLHSSYMKQLLASSPELKNWESMTFSSMQNSSKENDRIKSTITEITNSVMRLQSDQDLTTCMKIE